MTHCLLLVGPEGVAVESHPLCCRQLYEDIRLLQSDGVVARSHRLVGMREARLLTTTMGYGQEQHIAQIAHARTAEVHVTEAGQHRVTGMIARAPIPTSAVLCGTKLYQSEGHIRPKEHMSVTTRTYPGVHVVGIPAAVVLAVVGSLRGAHCEQRHQHNHGEFLHCVSFFSLQI